MLFRSRFRGTKSLVLAGAALVLMFVLFAAAAKRPSAPSEGTGQERIQLWDAGFEMFKRSPLIGVGLGQFVNNAGHVAHNAFIQDLRGAGFSRGDFPLRAILLLPEEPGEAGVEAGHLARPGDAPAPAVHPRVPGRFRHQRDVADQLFHLVTYVMFGLATAYIRLADPSPPLPDLLLNRRLICRTILYSGLFLVGLYVYVRLNVSIRLRSWSLAIGSQRSLCFPGEQSVTVGW